MKLVVLLIALAATLATHGRELKFEPPFWWTQMPVSQLQLQIHSPGIGSYQATVATPGIRILRQESVDSPNYLFLYLEIAPEAPTGAFPIQLATAENQLLLNYELRPREPLAGRNLGFDASDLVYLLMPDRFANGDPANDSIDGMIEPVNRADPTKRQGGDLKGIAQNLDYIANLGATAVWFTPVLENDMPTEYGAYHGYAVTDMYQIDRRFGSNEEYRELVRQSHQRGLKVIMDMIHNHIGINHWWMADLPAKDWLHDLDTYGLTNFRGTIPADPNASQHDRDRLIKGWFVPEMPDLDQRNPLLADYLIQNTIWWIEYSEIDGIRMDTYIYPYPEYMARWAKEVLAAYPTFNIVGESWVETVAQEAYWQRDRPGFPDGYNSHLPSVTDFPYCFAVRKGLVEELSWEGGLNRLYYLFSQDFLYSNPNDNVIFLDNHDMSRIYEQLGQDKALFKMAYAILATSRGVPILYYGTELMMGHEHRGGDDEIWRQTMPGGWPGDARSVFDHSGRSKTENEILSYIQKINTWRKSSPAAHRGRLVHFLPESNTYIYFRVLADQAIMVAINANSEPVSLDMKRFDEITKDLPHGVDILSGLRHDLRAPIQIPAKTCLVLQL